MEIATTFLSLVAGISGLVLAWRSFRLQARASVIDDLDQIRVALKEENERRTKEIERLQSRLKQAEKEILHWKHRYAVLEQRLDEERRIFSHRIEALEAEVRRWATVDNVDSEC